MNYPDVPPTPQERELWAKALQTPDQVTEAERLVILRQPDATTQAANCLEVSGLTPEELQDKALSSPDSMTHEECRLILSSYHIWSPEEATANCPIYWGHEDNTALTKAQYAVATTRENEVLIAASIRSDVFADAKRKEIQASMKKYAEDMNRPCKWVRNLIDPSMPWSEQTGRWGFVIFRDSAIDCDSSSWDRFLSVMDSCVDESLRQLVGGTAIIPTKEFILADDPVSENSPEILRSIFQQRLAEEAIPNPRVPSNTFLLVTPEVVDACINTSTPWIWAIWDRALFTWFYAVRSEELYNMALFWEKAQNQGQVWSVATQSGIYHHPFVLLEKGSSYPFNTYELDNGP
ncbi:hypothetical protein V502_07604 [Pseudogymnoascus sp. VKM F-4520 (FW-2644)]|nr:hypothetical protein V502_07604 [Pseudogymnoascus sp. VKM F-4520 (FW-2644)]